LFQDYRLSGPAQMMVTNAATAKQQVLQHYLSGDVNLEGIMAMRATLNKTLDEDKALSVMD
jgi:hypothetical protein